MISGDERSETKTVELRNKRELGIVTLGALKQHPRILSFRQFIEGWYLRYFTPDFARSIPFSGPQKHLNTHEDNLGNVVQFMERSHPKRFQNVLKNIAGKIPGIETITTERSLDGRLLICFNDKGFESPFYAQYISDGTLKLFAYLLMLEYPSPPPYYLYRRTRKWTVSQIIEIIRGLYTSLPNLCRVKRLG